MEKKRKLKKFSVPREKTVPFQIRMPVSLMEKLKAFCLAQKPPQTLTETTIDALKRLLRSAGGC